MFHLLTEQFSVSDKSLINEEKYTVTNIHLLKDGTL